MQIVWQYPEFILAALLSALLVFLQNAMPETSRFGWLMEPAKSSMLMLPESYLAWLQRCQLQSGWRGADAMAKLCALKIYPAILLFLAVSSVSLSFSVFVAIASFFVPDLILIAARARRQRQLVFALPQALDLIVLCIDAGLALDSALQRVASDSSALDGALSEELALLNRDILLGMDRERAYDDLFLRDRERAYDDLFLRTGAEDLRTLGSALNQSSKLGLSIAAVIRAQSDFVRLRQKQRVEERASKLSIYMVFPLWLCIMPALMVIVLAPSLLTFFRTVAHFPPEWFM